MSLLALGYAATGQNDRALKLFEETLALEKAKLGPDNIDTLGSMSNLALGYAAAGQNDRALKLREETLALQKTKLGPDHHDTLVSMSNLAGSYTVAGQNDRALEALRGDPGAAEGEARARPPRHAHEHAQPRHHLCGRRPARPGAEAPRGDPGATEGEARARPP